nr:hypothetical protein [Kibdelosporangium sp. MJ126-NF4]CEL17821.1 hypothetical protein [Kibdelosporangium sp. MJ126-NF4]CTQ90955.1 hypothetical protein [Kibdelosporangium sp. MJ126-NF4]
MIITRARLADLPDPRDPLWPSWLTRAELAYCTGFQRVTEHMAARVLAKRSALAVLGLDPDTPLADLEILRAASGAPSVSWGAGSQALGVSLTHAGGSAAAMAWRRAG